MIEYRTVTYEPKPGEKLVFGRKPGKQYQEAHEVPDPWYFAPPENGYVLCDTSRASSYSTQGYGADRYAKTAADLAADRYRSAGFEVTLREVAEESRSYAEFADIGFPKRRVYVGQRTYVPRFWQVWVRGENVAGPFTPVSTVGLAETVRQCWAKGVNPRVYYPFLPHGYEERHGFDHFGKTTSGGVH